MRSTGIDGKVSPQPISAHLITPKRPPPRNPGRAGQKIVFDLQLADLAVEFADLDFVGLVVPIAAVLEHAPSSSAFFQAWIWLGWTLNSLASSPTVRSPLSAAKATFALNVALCFCRDCFTDCSCF